MSPLFLYPFFGEGAVVVALLALVPLMLIWMTMEPSVYSGEMLHDARHRVMRAIMRDRFLWLLLAVLGYLSLCKLNGGVDYVYALERQAWTLSRPRWPYLPGSCQGFGWLPFAACLTFGVLMMAVRNAFGRQKTMVLTLFCSLLAGLSGVGRLFLLSSGGAVVGHDAPLYGVLLLASTVSVASAFEQRWAWSLPALVVAMAGNLTGVIGFGTVFDAVVFLSAWLVLSLFVLLKLRGRSVFFGGVGFPLVLLTSALVAWLLMQSLAPSAMDAKVSACADGKIFTPEFWASRRLLSGCAMSTWMEAPWVGSGLGTFGLALRNCLDAAGWAMVPKGACAASNCWVQLLAEGGIVAAVFLVMPTAWLLGQWARAVVAKFSAGLRKLEPAELLGPVCLSAVAATLTFGTYALPVGAVAMVLVLLAVSVKELESSVRRADNG